MTVNELFEQAKQLPRADQVDLCDRMQHLVYDDSDDLRLTPAQAADLDARISDIRSGKAVLHPGDEVFARLLQGE